MTTVLLCRHGRTDWNEMGRYQGQVDVPLNTEGWAEARQLAEQLRQEPLVAVYASDLSRAADTAHAIAKLHDLTVQRDPRLREINQGRWEGLTVEEIRRRDAPLLDLWETSPGTVTLPGGESLLDVRQRALAALDEALERYPVGVLCIVSHKVVQTIIRCALSGEDLEQALKVLPPNAAVQRLEVPSGYSPSRS